MENVSIIARYQLVEVEVENINSITTAFPFLENVGTGQTDGQTGYNTNWLIVIVRTIPSHIWILCDGEQLGAYSFIFIFFNFT